MIVLTRLNGHAFALNPDLIERAESTPDTVITLVDGKKLVVAESTYEVVTLVTDFRSSIIARAQVLETEMQYEQSQGPDDRGPQRGRVVPLPVREA